MLDAFLNEHAGERAAAVAAAFRTYAALLQERNTAVNLTAITETDEIERLHFVDSMLCHALLPQGAAVLDIGSGAGFPGVPLKLLRPDLRVVLIDSVQKKVRFLHELIETLGLAEITALHCRIEDYPVREAFDAVVTRAVAPLPVLIEYALPFLKIGGQLLAYKGPSYLEEVEQSRAALQRLGGAYTGTTQLRLDEQTVRYFVRIEKVSASPKGYPRGKNLPRTKPLL